MTASQIHRLKLLERELDGEVFTDSLHRIMYATDASVYRERPIGVVYPRHEGDLQKIVLFSREEKLPLIPRAGGTSLAGQVVGSGLVCDTSRYFTGIIEVDQDARTVRLQPGVIRDVLNLHLKDSGLFFGPNTSTSNRCNIGGMIGNNSCGTSSIRYGATRDKIHSIRTLTSDGAINEVGPITEPLKHLYSGQRLNDVLKYIFQTFEDRTIREKVMSAFPKPEINRRNTGYAIDDLCQRQPFARDGEAFNLARLLCGSEGTLALTTEATLILDPLPPVHYAMVTLEFDTVNKALLNVKPAMAYDPFQCELMDDVILSCTKKQPKYKSYLSLIEGEPKAVLMVELRAETHDHLADLTIRFKHEMEKLGLARSIRIHNELDSDRLWELRKAGLGLLANLQGEGVAVACIEDTAVSLDDLPDYIKEFEELMHGYGQNAVYYAHAGAGELHLRPILNLKTEEGRQQFKSICSDSADLVKKYRGALSGEHGDGRVRAAFIKRMVGDEVYSLLEQMKNAWDPEGIFNPGKIVNAQPIDLDLRYLEGPDRPSFYRFEEGGGLLGMAEKCNGSGDCRKIPETGGTMCPSYHATRREKDTTRARANVLREILIDGDSPQIYQRREMKEVLDLCLSCKACQKECPSNVDMAIMKSEFLHQFHQDHRRPLRDYMFAALPELGQRMPGLTRFGMKAFNTVGRWMKPLLGLHPRRPLPLVDKASLVQKAMGYGWDVERVTDKTVLIFCDEFTNLLDSEIGMQAILLLEHFGFDPILTPPMDSCRALFSKGMLEKAREKVNQNLQFFSDIEDRKLTMVGIEPSAILGLCDEWKRICDSDHIPLVESLAERAMPIEHFLWQSVVQGTINKDHFEEAETVFHVHGHCHFKAQTEEDPLYHLLGVLPGGSVQKIPSGCCGMAGSFGYEKEHFDVSHSVGEQVLFPYIRDLNDDDIIVANGMSCRHQISDFLGRKAFHPIEVLASRLK